MTALTEILLEELPPAARDWLAGALEAAASDAQALTAFAVAARKVPGVTLSDPARAAVGLPWLVEGASLVELARVALLLAHAARGGDYVRFLEECFRQGDNGEKRAVLRALALAPDPEALVPLAAMGTRSNVQTVFEAVACENPFPARWFPESPFNQMVLKALFTGVPLRRIVDLDGRLNPELARMAGDYAAERRAAGRPLPEDIGRVMQPGAER